MEAWREADIRKGGERMTKLRIKELRIINKMSQSKLAIKLNISQNTLSNWENGKYEPDIKALIKLSEILHSSIDYIVGNI